MESAPLTVHGQPVHSPERSPGAPGASRGSCAESARIDPGLKGGVKGKPNTPELLRKDLRMLALFIKIYCHAHHEQRSPVVLKGFDLQAITGRELELCPSCFKLLAHAFVKRSHCPMDPKPQCKHCPNHCYHPSYRKQIQEVMRFSGKKMVMSGRIDYLLHLWF